MKFTQIKLSLVVSLSVLMLVLSTSYITAINFCKKGSLYCDYGVFYRSTTLALEGKDIYMPSYVIKKNTETSPTKKKPRRRADNLNPPFFTLLILPLGYLAYSTSILLWSGLSIAAGILSLWLLQKKIFPAASPTKKLALGLAFFIYYPTYATIHFGQTTLFLLPFVVGAWLAEREKNSYVAALLLGIATSIKPFFGLFLVYFLLRREWRKVFLFVATIIVGLATSAIFFGKETFLSYHEVLQQVAWFSSSWNASILGVLLRIFGGNHEFNFAIVPVAGLVEKLYLPLCGILLFILIRILWPQSKINSVQKSDIDFSTTLIILLLISPLSWVYYFPLLIIPIVVLLQFAKNNYYPLLLSVLVMVCIGLSGLAVPLFAANAITSQNALPVFLWSSCYTLALLILMGIFYFLRNNLPKYNNKISKEMLSLNTFTFLLVIALLPSLIGILRTTYQITVYGDSVVIEKPVTY